MVIIKFDFVLLLTIFQVSHCERRILEGEELTAEKRYVVYLVKAHLSDKKYDSWVCGGALVSREFIITSAACVEDVQYMYAIAGYRKYVLDKDLDEDVCTSQMKKKIVYTCVPISYEFDFDEVEKWAYIDIALVKVESPYDFSSPAFQLMCSYIPSIIPINYDPKRQAANLDAIVLGWGHTEIWRAYGDHKIYNSEYLRFGATTLYDKNLCKEAYKDYPILQSTIDKYMICSFEPGHLNDHGIPYTMNQKKKELRTDCITQKQKLQGLQGELCEDEIMKNNKEVKEQDKDARKQMSLQEKSINSTNKDNGTNILNRTNSVNETDYIYKPGFGKIRGYFNGSFSRRNGICQNDHGGPIITWAGRREILIGVASVFKITEDNKCIGPFLYTSTVCNGAFIGCVLGDKRANVLRGHNESVNPREALLCDSDPSVKGFDTIESYVSWKDHPAGPADNERDIGQNMQNAHYAKIVQEDSDSSPLEDEKKPKDRFSVKIGVPPKRERRPRIRKRPPVQQRPPAQQMPPVQQRPLVQQSAPVQKWPSVQQRPLLQQWLPLKRDTQLINRSPGMESPALKRRPAEMKPPPEYAPPTEMKPSPEYAPPPEMKPPPEYAPPPEMKPPPEYAPPPEMKPPPEYAPPPENKPAPKYATPPEMKPPPKYATPSEMKPPPKYATPPEMKHPPKYATPPEKKPPPEYAPPPELSSLRSSPEIDRPSILRRPPENGPPSFLSSAAPKTLPKMEDPGFEEMLDFKSDEKKFEKTANMYTKTANYHVRAQPQFALRPQSPLNG